MVGSALYYLHFPDGETNTQMGYITIQGHTAKQSFKTHALSHYSVVGLLRLFHILAHMESDITHMTLGRMNGTAQGLR